MELKKATVEFGHCDSSLGKSWSCKNHIKIDLKRHTNPIHTYVHEQIHLNHPDWTETRVLRQERLIWKKLTHKEIFLLGKRLFNRKWKDTWIK